jgi:hypothetical protein
MGLIIILVILIIFVIGIMVFINCKSVNNYNRNKNTFYGLPPGKHRAVGVNDLGNDLGWATFANNNIAQLKKDCVQLNGLNKDCVQLNGLNNDCGWCGPLDGLNNYCNISGHQGTTPSAMVNYIEFSPNVN